MKYILGLKPRSLLINPNSPSPVNIYSEFQPLEEVIVGRTYSPDAFAYVKDEELKSSLQRIMFETEEDLKKLCHIFEAHGVVVRRPEILFDLYEPRTDKTKLKMQDVGIWSAGFPNPPLWPRDLTLALGKNLFSLYARTPNRFFESAGFYSLFREYFEGGANWVSLPPPLLNNHAAGYVDYEGKALLYHAACFVRCGRDVFHTLPASLEPRARGTLAALDWVQRQCREEFRFRAVNSFGHLDGKIAFLRPGLLMSWLKKEQLPAELQTWDIISLTSKRPLPAEFESLRGRRYYGEFVQKWLSEWIGSVDETYFDVNCVSLDEKTVLVNGDHPDLIRKLKSYGIEAIPFDFRHRYFWDGGLHCITLDVRRRGLCEDYFR